MLQQRHQVSFNNLIQEGNKNISLEFYANVEFSKVGTYTSYVRGKYVNYSPSSINSLFNLQPPPVYALRTYRNEHKFINEAMAQEMIEAFCRPWEECMVGCGLALRLKIAEFL